MIKIINQEICENCKTLSCSFLKTGLTRFDFCKLSSETTVCPTQILSEGPYEAALDSGIIDKDLKAKKSCIDCGLCVKNCTYKNLEFLNLKYDIDSEAFDQLTEPQLKAITTSFLGFLFKFSANTNRNKSLQFDGFITTSTEQKAFVEIDWKNDSLECTRRLLGDILTYKSQSEINLGLIVLQDIPVMGSRDVYNVLEKIKQFPTTKHIQIFITSIPIIRWIMIYAGTKNYNIEQIAFNPLEETKDEYIKRINLLLPEDAQII